MLNRPSHLLKVAVCVVVVATTGSLHAHGTVGVDADEARTIDFPDTDSLAVLCTASALT